MKEWIKKEMNKERNKKKKDWIKWINKERKEK